MRDEYIKHLIEIKGEIERTWGLKRLLTLVSDSLRDKFVKAEDTFARNRSKVDGVASRKLYESMIRGYLALIQEAEDLGFEPVEPETWIIKHPNNKDSIVIVRDPDLASRVHHKYKKEAQTKVIHINNLLSCVDWSLVDFTLDLSKTVGDVTIKEAKFH
tara:strand:+ start:2872 stop:3348 length:477 start_codon:yes stop_codon:yes gene_type:complete